MSKSILIIAAEASSTPYAEQVIEHLKKLDPSLQFFGVGSKAMEKKGFECLGYAENLAVVGVVEVLKHYSEIKTVFDRVVLETNRRKPSAVLLLDYPGFNLKLAKELKSSGHRIFYYISPQIWAWKQDRIFTIKKFVDRVFLILPFEKDFYKKHDVPFEFVGHPLLDDLNPDLTNPQKIELRRQKYGIKKSEMVLLIMPGSRKGEIERHLQVQLESASLMMQKYSNLRLVIAGAPTLSKDYLIEKIGNFKSPFILLQEHPNDMISLADIVLVASGTATLMVALLEKPMLIMYKVNWLTGLIAKRLTRHLRFFGLPNLILNEPVITELKQDEVNPERIIFELEKFMNDDYRNSVIGQLKTIKNLLGERGASEKVARHLWQVINQSDKQLGH